MAHEFTFTRTVKADAYHGERDYLIPNRYPENEEEYRRMIEALFAEREKIQAEPDSQGRGFAFDYFGVPIPIEAGDTLEKVVASYNVCETLAAPYKKRRKDPVAPESGGAHVTYHPGDGQLAQLVKGHPANDKKEIAKVFQRAHEIGLHYLEETPSLTAQDLRDCILSEMKRNNGLKGAVSKGLGFILRKTDTEGIAVDGAVKFLMMQRSLDDDEGKAGDSGVGRS